MIKYSYIASSVATQLRGWNRGAQLIWRVGPETNVVLSKVRQRFLILFWLRNMNLLSKCGFGTVGHMLFTPAIVWFGFITWYYQLLLFVVHCVSLNASFLITYSSNFNECDPILSIYTVFQKSDAKIEITITTTNLITIKYPLSSFNYCLSGANVANFNKIHLTVFEQQLFKKSNSKTEVSNMEKSP